MTALEPPLQFLDGLVRVIEVVLVPILWKVYAALSGLTTQVGELRTVLIGSDGKDGIRSRVRRLEVRQERIALFIASQGGEYMVKPEAQPEDSDE